MEPDVRALHVSCLVALRHYGGLIWFLVMCAARNMGEPDSLFGPMSVIFQQPWGSRYDPNMTCWKANPSIFDTMLWSKTSNPHTSLFPLQLHVIVVSKKQEIHLQDMPRNTSVLPGSADVAGVDHPISAWKGCNGCFSPELCEGTLLMMMMMMPMRNHSFQLCFLRTTV